MTRLPVYILAALLAAAPLSAAAQDRGDRAEARQERRGGGGGGGGSQDGGDRGESRRQSERPSREQSEQAPRVSMGAAVQRASAGRPGRFLGASNRGDTIVVRWEYPGGRVADIMVDGRTGRVIGER